MKRKRRKRLLKLLGISAVFVVGWAVGTIDQYNQPTLVRCQYTFGGPVVQPIN